MYILFRLLYLYSDMGKYVYGGCGASGDFSGTQRLYAVGIVGGSLDSVYTLVVDVMLAMASESVIVVCGASATAVSPSAGAATLEPGVSPSLTEKAATIVVTYALPVECSINSVDSSDWVMTES